MTPMALGRCPQTPQRTQIPQITQMRAGTERGDG